MAVKKTNNLIDISIIALTLLYLLAFALNATPYLRGPGEWRWAYAIPGFPGRHWVPVFTITLYVVLIIRWGGKLLKSETPLPRARLYCFLAVLALAGPLIQASLLYPESPDILRPLFYRTVSAGASGVFSVGTTIEDLGAFLRAYPQLMPAFPVHPQRYPPGLPVLFYIMRQFLQNLPGLSDSLGYALRLYQCHDPALMRLSNPTLATAVLQMALPALSALVLFPLYGLAHRTVGRRAALWAVMLYPLIPSFALWSARWDQFYPLVTCTSWYMFYRGLTMTRGQSPARYGWLLGGGLVLSFASFLSFGLLVLLMSMGLSTLLWLWYHPERRHWAQLAGDAAVFFGGLVVPWLVYQLVFGTGFIDIWRVSMSYHLGLSRDYGTWLFFHFYDFFAFLGIPVSLGFGIGLGFALWRLFKPSDGRKEAVALPIGFTLGLLLLNLSGTARGEVARVWLFLTPFAVITAAYGLEQLTAKFAPSVPGRRFALVIVLLAANLLVFNAFLRVVTTGITDPPERQRVFQLPSLPYTLDAQLGDGIALLGYELTPENPRPGESLHLRLVWQSLSQAPQSYNVFTHLVAPDGTLTAQQDGVPLGGTAPTACWIPGEVIVDAYTLEIPDDIQPGEYMLRVGLYLWQTGERLSVQGADALPDNSVLITTLPLGN